MKTTIGKNREGYGYRYTDIAKIHEYLEANDMKYIQYIVRVDGDDYIYTKRFIDGKWEEQGIPGCRVVQAILNGKSNPAQEQGSAITYARRYSLLMAFGLATDDDDGESLTRAKDSVIDSIKKEALESSIEKNNITDAAVEKILSKYGFSSTAEITISKYGDIVNEFRKLVK